MATRGAKPKAGALRVVDGTHRKDRHGDPAKVLADSDSSLQSFGKMKRPSFITGEARKAWDRWIAPADWLDASREASAIAFCEMWKAFRRDPERFPAAYHGQMRAYMAELGLTDERNRVKTEGDGPKDPSDSYF